jgi:hypothetical protein
MGKLSTVDQTNVRSTSFVELRAVFLAIRSRGDRETAQS